MYVQDSIVCTRLQRGATSQDWGVTVDSWGNLLSSSESFTNGWSNLYRYDGHDGARYDASAGLSWLAVRAYDPSIGRFLARDPLGRAPLFFADNPSVYAGNNPITSVDPSGQKVMGASNSQVKQASKARVQSKYGNPPKKLDSYSCNVGDRVCDAQQVASDLALRFGGIDMALKTLTLVLAILTVVAAAPFTGGTEFAPLLLFLTVTVGVMDIYDSQLQTEFNREASKLSGWYTESNFSAFSTSVGATVASFLAVATVVGDVFMVMTPFLANPIVASAIGPFLVAAGAGFRVGSLLSVAIFGSMALANIRLQRQLLFGV